MLPVQAAVVLVRRWARGATSGNGWILASSCCASTPTALQPLNARLHTAAASIRIVAGPLSPSDMIARQNPPSHSCRPVVSTGYVYMPLRL